MLSPGKGSASGKSGDGARRSSEATAKLSKGLDRGCLTPSDAARQKQGVYRFGQARQGRACCALGR